MLTTCDSNSCSDDSKLQLTFILDIRTAILSFANSGAGGVHDRLHIYPVLDILLPLAYRGAYTREKGPTAFYVSSEIL